MCSIIFGGGVRKNSLRSIIRLNIIVNDNNFCNVYVYLLLIQMQYIRGKII